MILSQYHEFCCQKEFSGHLHSPTTQFLIYNMDISEFYYHNQILHEINFGKSDEQNNAFVKLLQDLNFEFAVVLHILKLSRNQNTGQELIKLALFEEVDCSKLISRKISLVEISLISTISTIQNLPSEIQHNYHHLFRENVTLEFYKHKKLTDTVHFFRK